MQLKWEYGGIKMVDLNKLQKEIYQNKVDKGFNVTDVNKEFCLTYGEIAEAYDAWRKKKDDLGEELADVTIYLLGLSEILGINLEDEIQKKVLKNAKRQYKIINGVNTRVKECEEKMGCENERVDKHDWWFFEFRKIRRNKRC